MQKLQGWVEQGNTTLLISGAAGIITRKVQGSYPGATVTVYINNPPAVAIVGAISRTSNNVVVNVLAGSGFIAGQLVTIAGVADASFNGVFTIVSASSSFFSFHQVGANGASTGGTASSTLRLASIYNDNDSPPTAKANPFVSASDGTWFFYAAPGLYDVRFSGGGITAPFTIGGLGASISTYLGDAYRSACDFPGGDAGTQIAAAIASLPLTGGVVDARCFQGAQVIAVNMYAGISKPVKLLLGAATFGLSVTQVMPDNCEIEGIGAASVIQSVNNDIHGIIPGNFNYLHDFTLSGTSVPTHDFSKGIGIRMTHNPEVGAGYINRDMNSPVNWTGYNLVMERMLVENWGFIGVWCGPHSRILNNQFINNAAEGILSAGGYVIIKNNFIRDTQSWGIDVNGGHAIISGNELYNVGDYDALNLWADGNDMGGIVLNSTSTSSGIFDSVISDNIIDTSDGDGILVVEPDVYDASNIVIAGNTIKNTVVHMTVPGGAIVTVQGGAGVRPATLTGTVIASNSIKSSGQAGIILNAGTQATVSSNWVDTVGTFGIGTTDGHALMYDIAINSNQIRSAATYGIFVGNVTGVGIRGNRISNGGGAQVGVKIDTGCDQVNVADNQVSGGGSHGYQFVSVTNLHATNNLAKGTGAIGFLIQSTDYPNFVGGFATGNALQGWKLEASHLGLYNGIAAMDNGAEGVLAADGAAGPLGPDSGGNIFNGIHSGNRFGGGGTQTYGWRETGTVGAENLVSGSNLWPNATAALSAFDSSRLWNNINSTGTGVVRDQLFGATRCFSNAHPADCFAYPIGYVTIAPGTTTVVVNTTAVVSANSNIFVVEDVSVAGPLGVGCNGAFGRTYTITAKAAGTFTITSDVAPAVNPACLSFWVVN